MQEHDTVFLLVSVAHEWLCQQLHLARGLLQYMERENRFHLHFHHKEVGSHHFHRSVVAKVHLVVVVEVDVVEAELVVELLVLEVDVVRAELVV